MWALALLITLFLYFSFYVKIMSSVFSTQNLFVMFKLHDTGFYVKVYRTYMFINCIKDF